MSAGPGDGGGDRDGRRSFGSGERRRPRYDSDRRDGGFRGRDGEQGRPTAASAAPPGTGAARTARPAQPSGLRPLRRPGPPGRRLRLQQDDVQPHRRRVPGDKTGPAGAAGPAAQRWPARRPQDPSAAAATGRIVRAGRRATVRGRGRAVTSIATGSVRTGVAMIAGAALPTCRGFPTASPRTSSPAR